MAETKGSQDRPAIKVVDRRHWARKDREEAAEDAQAAPPSTHPTLVDEYKLRGDAAERKLQEYIAAYKETLAEQEQFRARLSRDVERRVELQFGSLVGELLEAADDLDLALAHAEGVPEAGPLARGVALARDRFLGTLQRHGVERMDLGNSAFDPNLAEAVRVDPVDDAERDGTVTETLRPGYRLGDRVIRPAQVAVGRRPS